MRCDEVDLHCIVAECFAGTQQGIDFLEVTRHDALQKREVGKER